jgi:two-component system sensor histidine kinase KdpD
VTPATPATPAVPATPEVPAVPAVPATPATPTVPAVPSAKAKAAGGLLTRPTPQWKLTRTTPPRTPTSPPVTRLRVPT